MTGDLRVATKKSSRDDKGTPRCFFVVGGWGWYVLLFHFGEFFCSQTALKRKTRYLCTSLFLSDMNEFFLLSFRILCFFSHLKPKPLPLFVGFQKWSFFSEKNSVGEKASHQKWTHLRCRGMHTSMLLPEWAIGRALWGMLNITTRSCRGLKSDAKS